MTIGEAVQRLRNAPQHLELRANVDDTSTKVTLVGFNPEDGTELELVRAYKQRSTEAEVVSDDGAKAQR